MQVVRSIPRSIHGATIKALSKKNPLDYTLAVKLFRDTNTPLTREEADDLLEITKRAQCDVEPVYSAYMQYLSNRGDSAKLIQTFQTVREKLSDREGNAHTHALRAMYNTGDLKGMAEIAEELKTRNRITFSSKEAETLLSFYAHSSPLKYSQWWKCFALSAINLSREVYEEGIRLLREREDPVFLEIFETMQRRGVHPSETTYANLLKDKSTFDRLLPSTRTVEARSTLLVHCARNDELVLSQQLVDYVYTHVRRPKGVSFFSNAAYNALIAAYARRGLIGGVRSTMNKMAMVDIKPDVIAYEVSLSLISRLGDDQRCWKLIEKMHKSKIQMTPSMFLSLMDMYITKKDTRSCEQLFNKAKEMGIASSKIYDKLISVYAAHGNLQKALDCLAMMHKEGIQPTTSTYNLIISAHANHGLAQACNNVFREMKKQNVAPDLHTFSGLVHVHIKKREFSSCRKIFEEIQQVAPQTNNAFESIMVYHNMKSHTVERAPSM